MEIYEDIPKVAPSLKGSASACKRALVEMLREKYKTIDAFNAAWGGAARSFDDLNDVPHRRRSWGTWSGSSGLS